MSEGDWISWVERHAALFSMNRSEDLAMFRQWRTEFEAMYFSAKELHDATDYISREATGVTRWDHLHAIRDFIKANRRRESETANKRLQITDDKGTCTKCANTGRVCGLPHPSQLTVDGWTPLISGVPPVTISATCTCPAGLGQQRTWEERTPQFKEDYPRPMSLIQYTRLNPQWEAQLRELAEVRKAKRASEAVTSEADKWGKLKARPATVKGLDEMANVAPQALKAIEARGESAPVADDERWPSEVEEYADAVPMGDEL